MFRHGDYTAVRVEGERREHVIAFVRRYQQTRGPDRGAAPEFHHAQRRASAGKGRRLGHHAVAPTPGALRTRNFATRIQRRARHHSTTMASCYAEKFSPASPWPFSSHEGWRSVTSASVASFCASSGSTSPGQITPGPVAVAKTGHIHSSFRARPSTSCSGTTQRFAVELCARRTIAQLMPSLASPSSAPANFAHSPSSSSTIPAWCHYRASRYKPRCSGS